MIFTQEKRGISAGFDKTTWFRFVAYLSHCIRKPTKCLGENKGAVTAKLISAFVFTIRIVDIVQSLFFLNPKFKLLACFCDCTSWFVSDLVETQMVCFLFWYNFENISRETFVRVSHGIPTNVAYFHFHSYNSRGTFVRGHLVYFLAR